MPANHGTDELSSGASAVVGADTGSSVVDETADAAGAAGTVVTGGTVGVVGPPVEGDGSAAGDAGGPGGSATGAGAASAAGGAASREVGTASGGVGTDAAGTGSGTPAASSGGKVITVPILMSDGSSSPLWAAIDHTRS